MPPAQPALAPAPTAEELPLELWVIIVNVFLRAHLPSIASLSLASRTCRAAAHTLKHTVEELGSEVCLRALVESGAWPRLTFQRMVATAVVPGIDESLPSRLATLLPLMAAWGIAGLRTDGAGLAAYLEHHAAAHPLARLWVETVLTVPESLGQLAPTLASLRIDGSRVPVPKDSGPTLGLAIGLPLYRMMSVLPESIGLLRALTSLDLSASEGLRALPESIGQLSALTSLDLSTCQGLGSLPESIGQLSALTSLSLARCFWLSSLPESFGQLSALTTLDMKDCNSLMALPESFWQLGALTELSLSGCPRLNVPLAQIRGLPALTKTHTLGCAVHLRLALEGIIHTNSQRLS